MISLEGIITALVTPFTDNKIDETALALLVKIQLDAGVNGFVVCGTTGEASALEDDEYVKVISIVVDLAKGKVPIIAGTGLNNTSKTIKRTRMAFDAGADCALVVTPYYNKPQQEGLFRHYKAVAEEGGLPVIIYNVPSRTGVSISVETVERLSREPRIIGIKEAQGSVSVIREIVSHTPPTFAVLSGDDNTCFPSFAVGAKGVISVASNVVCDLMVGMWKSWKEGRIKEAQEIDRMLSPLYSALFLETNPAPVKAALYMLGMASDQVRSPLVIASEKTREALRVALKKAQVTCGHIL